MSGSAEVLNKKKVKVLEKNYCPKQDSNAGPCDLQSSALPSELQICWQKVVQLYFTYLHVRRPVRTEIMIWSWQFAILKNFHKSSMYLCFGSVSADSAHLYQS